MESYGILSIPNTAKEEYIVEKKIKVLIADDTTEFGHNCSNVLKSYGFDVKQSPKDGVAVLQEIDRNKPDVVLMDMFMPNLDSLAVMERLGNDGKAKPITMIMSSCDNAQLEKEALSSGASYYLIKPFDIEMLADRIASCLTAILILQLFTVLGITVKIPIWSL